MSDFETHPVGTGKALERLKQGDDRITEFKMVDVWVETMNMEELMNIEWVTAARAMLLEFNVCPHCVTHASYDPENERWYCIECTWNSDWEI